MKNILYKYEISAKIQATGFKEGYTEKAHLLKYFPKYYKRLTVDVVDHSTISRIKRLKRVHHFMGFFKPTQSRNLLYSILGNKRKDLYSLPLVSSDSKLKSEKETSETRLKKLKFFPNIRKLHIPKFALGIKTENSDYVKTWGILTDLQKACRFISNMRNLRILVISDIDSVENPAIPLLIKKLIKSNQFYSKELVLNLNLKAIKQIWHDFVSNIDLWKRVTHFNLIEMPNSTIHDVNIEIIFPKFQNLRFLSMMGFCHEIPNNFFESLKTLQNLETFKLAWQNYHELIDIFSLPSSIKFVYLDFDVDCLVTIFLREIDWEKIDDDTHNVFETMERYQKFYTKWESLVNLSALVINFCEARDFSVLAKYFITPILKRIPKLTSFTYEVEGELCSRYFNSKDETNFLRYLPFSANVPENFLSSLRQLTIHLNQEYMDEVPIGWDLSSFFKTFHNLSSLTLKGCMSFELKLPDSVDIFGRDLSEEKSKEILIDAIIVNSSNMFKNILKRLNKIQQIKGLKLNLKISISVNENELDLVLNEFYNFQKQYNAHNNIKIHLIFGKDQNIETIESFFLNRVDLQELEVSYNKGKVTHTYWCGKIIRSFPPNL